MNGTPGYTAYHPRWLRQHVSTYWWLQKRSYFTFILREASCLFVAWVVVYLLMLVRAVTEGVAMYQAFLAWSAQPWILSLNILTFAFLVLHAITFFVAAPQALVLHVRGKRVPGPLVAASHYAAWVGASILIFLVLVVLGGER
jgi:fumarate reductase subunit C